MCFLKVFATLLLLFADAPPDDNRDQSEVSNVQRTDADALQGAWKLVAEVKDGKRSPVAAGTTIVVSGGRWTIAEGNAEFTFELRDDREPKEIDWSPSDGTGSWLGIYQLNGDELILCLNSPDKDRPRVFRDDPASGVHIHVRQRVPSSEPMP